MHWACSRIWDFSESDIQGLYARLSPSRKTRIDRLRRPEDKRRSLAAELLVYDLLKKHGNISTAQLHCHDNGQPYLSGCKLSVSISHSEDVVACAISETPVGIDIERIRPIDLRMCRLVCLPEELEYVSPPPAEGVCHDEEILRRFFEIWTAKEAYFKKCGTGITNLKGINVLPLQRQVYQLDGYLIQLL